MPIEKTKFADYPQIVWKFITGEGTQFSVWSKLTVSPTSKIGTFLTAIRGSEIPLGPIQPGTIILKKNSVEALVDTRPDPKGVRRTMIIRFRAITESPKENKEVEIAKKAVENSTKELRVEKPGIHQFM